MTREKGSFKLGLAAIAFGMVFVAGCSGGDSGSKTASNDASKPATGGDATPSAGSDSSAKRPAPKIDGPSASGDTIKIAVIGSLTGDQRPWGEDSRDAAQMAVDEFNAAGGVGGKKVEMLVEDSASKPESAKSAAEKGLSDGAIAIVGEVSSGNTRQIAQSAYEKGVPVVAIGATNPDVTEVGTNVFRVCYTDDFQGPVMAKFAYEKLGLRNVGIMTDNKLPYSQGLSAAFTKEFTSLGGKIAVEEKYETGQNQFSSQLTELKAKQPDGLFCSGYFPEVGPIAQQARQAGIKVPMFGGDGWDSDKLLDGGGQDIIGGYFCNHYNNADNRPQVGQFLTKWKAKHGGKAPATTMGPLAYDAMALTLDALKRAKTPSSKDLLAAIEDTTDFKGVTGDITMKGNNGNPPKRAIIVKVGPKDANGDWQKFAFAYTPDQLKK